MEKKKKRSDFGTDWCRTIESSFRNNNISTNSIQLQKTAGRFASIIICLLFAFVCCSLATCFFLICTAPHNAEPKKTISFSFVKLMQTKTKSRLFSQSFAVSVFASLVSRRNRRRRRRRKMNSILEIRLLSGNRHGTGIGHVIKKWNRKIIQNNNEEV